MAENFRSLLVWQKAEELAVLIYSVSKSFPKEEQFGLTNQLRRAAVSVGANIAESTGRSGLKDKIQFLMISRGSLTETQSHISIAARLGFLEEKLAEKIIIDYEELARKINAFVKSLGKAQPTN